MVVALLSSAPHAGAISFTPGELAWQAFLDGRFEEAVALGRNALAADPQDARGGYALLGALLKLGRGREVEAVFDSLAVQHDESGVGPMGQGHVALQRRDFAAAESLFVLAERRFRDTRAVAGEILARELRGLLREQQNRKAEAESLYLSALEEAERLGRPLSIAGVLLHLGTMLVSTQQHDRAEAHLLRLVDLSRMIEAPIWEGDAYLHLSIIARWRGDLDRVMAHREAALDAYRRAGSRLGEARTLHYLGVTHLMRGELTRAMRVLQEALAASRAAGDSGEVAGCLGDLAGLSNLIGQEDQAIALSEEALRIGEGVRPRKWEALVLGNIGAMLGDQGRFPEAQQYLERALEAARAAGDQRYELNVLEQTGRCHCAMGSWTDGVRVLREAVTRAREWGSTLTEAQALASLGHCHLMEGNVAAAEQAFAEADHASSAAGYFEIRSTVLHGRAKVARAQGRRAEALRLLEESLSLIESVRARSRGAERVQMGYFGRSRERYEEAIDLLYEMKGGAAGEDLDRRAFDLVQRALARALQDLLAEAEVDLRSRADPRFQERERQILSRIAELAGGGAADSGLVPEAIESEIARQEDALLLLEATLREQDARYAAIRYPQTCTLGEVQDRVLRPGEVLVQYLLGEQASYLWLLARDRFRFIRLPARGQIEAQVRALLPLLRDYNVLGAEATYYVAPARALYETLLRPISADLAGAASVVIVPDGILHYLPFEALLVRDPERGDPTFESLPYLVHQTVVSYTSSVGTLDLLRRARREPPAALVQALLVGDPVAPSSGDRSALAVVGGGGAPLALRHAGEELQRIAAQFAPDAVLMLRGPQATPAELRRAGEARAYRFVHIAAHGLFNDRRPRFSGLLLSPDPATRDDGFLTVGRVFGHELRCHQVVLSACSSALGEEVSGEGLVGLTRAFMYAGAQGVVAALWEVPDEPAAELMAALYARALRPDAAGVASALTEAKREMIARGHSLAHPHCWAGFTLSGDDR
jgi:CHAT domain-containing protein/Tfp pilus assembly protein PilF